LTVAELKEAIIRLDRKKVEELTTQLLKGSAKAEEILNDGLIAGMREVGELFARKEYFVPEVLLAADCFYIAFNLISPLLKAKKGKEKGKIVIGVVQGDIHDIGKNIVKVMLEVNGYEVIDLGRDVPHHRFVKAVREEKPKVLALSALMTTTMLGMADIIQMLKEEKLREEVKVIIGGAATSAEFASKIGADGYGEDATAAVKIIESLTIE